MQLAQGVLLVGYPVELEAHAELGLAYGLGERIVELGVVALVDVLNRLGGAFGYPPIDVLTFWFLTLF